MDKNIVERAIVGALLTDPKRSVGELVGKISPEMFSSQMMGMAYEKLLSLYSETGKTDSIPVVVCLSKHYPENDVKVIIAECVQDLVSVRNIKIYSDELVKQHKSRALSRICSSYAMIEQDPDDVNETLENLASELGDLMRQSEKRGLHSVNDIAVKHYQQIFEPRKQSDTFRTGFLGIDKRIGSLERGNLIVLAARPKVGKSAFALSIANNMASKGLKTGLFSMEMNEGELFERLLANQANINLGMIRNREVTSNRAGDAAKATAKIAKLPLHIDSSGRQTVETITTEVRLKGLDVAIIDYIQLMSCNGRSNNRTEEITKITRGLKVMAQQLGIVVIALSQLNRNKNEFEEPELSDLRDSGSIEQDANQVWFMWINGEQGEQVQKEVAFKIAANRSGTTGSFVFDYIGGVMKFTETNKEIIRNTNKNKKRAPWE